MAKMDAKTAFLQKVDFRGGRPLPACSGLIAAAMAMAMAVAMAMAMAIAMAMAPGHCLGHGYGHGYGHGLCENCPWPFCAKWPWTNLTQTMDRQLKKNIYIYIYQMSPNKIEETHKQTLLD